MVRVVLDHRIAKGSPRQLASLKQLRRITQAARQSGQFTPAATPDDPLPFANLVSVSFSAFDDFEIIPEKKDRSEGLQYSYVGLRRTTGDSKATAPKSPQMLAKEFVESARTCGRGARLVRWSRALEMLEADPLFKEAEVAAALAKFDGALNEFEEEASGIARGLVASG